MSEGKHKMGEWYVDASNIEHGCCWSTGVSSMVPHGEGNYRGSVRLIAECSEDHAHLISAAPDMLEALEGLVLEASAQVVAIANGGSMKPIDITKAIQRACAAISKAKGRE